MEKHLRQILEQNQKERRQLQKKYEKVATSVLNIQRSSLFISTKHLHFMQKGVVFEIKLQDERMQGEGDKDVQDLDEKNEVKYRCQ